jgi:hypothetical protein
MASLSKPLLPRKNQQNRSVWIIWRFISNNFNQIGLNRAAASARGNRAATSVRAAANFWRRRLQIAQRII